MSLVSVYPASRLLSEQYEWVDVGRNIAVGFALCLISGWVIYLILGFSSLQHPGKLVVLATANAALWHGSAIGSRFGLVASILGIGFLAAGVGFIAKRLEPSGLVSALATALLVFVVLVPLVQGIMTGIALSRPTLDSLSDEFVVELEPGTPVGPKSDVIVIVLDGYPSPVTLERDLGINSDEFVRSMESAGFHFPELPWVPYPLTRYSLPSLLDMDLKLADGQMAGRADVRRLFLLSGGEAALFRILSANDYDTHFFESGWVGSTCRTVAGRCYRSPLPGEFAYNMLVLSVMSRFLPVANAPWASATKSTIRQLPNVIRAETNDSERDLIFAHLMLPHEPYVFDERCEFSLESENLTSLQAFSEQLACTNSFMLRIAELASPDATVLFLSDHGTNSRGQIETDEWSDAAIRERLTGFVALKLPPSCGYPSIEESIQAVVSVVNCAVGSNIPNHPRGVLLANSLPAEKLPATRLYEMRQCALTAQTSDC